MRRKLIEVWELIDEPMRYHTAADWICNADGSLTVLVPRMSDPRYPILLALHETIEATLCAEHGIKQSVVDEFDKLFEAEREAGLHRPEEEPGNDDRSPYRRPHCVATVIEQMLAEEMNVDWESYSKEIASL